MSDLSASNEHPILTPGPRPRPSRSPGKAGRSRPGRGKPSPLGPVRPRRTHLQLSSQGPRPPGHLLRQRPVRPMPRPGRRPAGQGLHGARPARARGSSPWTGFPSCRPFPARPARRPIEEIAVPVLIIGGGPAGLSAAIELGKRGVAALLDRRQAPPRRQARPSNPPLLRLLRRGLRRDARHRHRHQARKRAPDLSQRPDLAPEHGPGRLQRQKGRHPQGWQALRPGQARGRSS